MNTDKNDLGIKPHESGKTTSHDLSIEQMREIVEGAPSNIASHFCAGEYFERWSKYDWCRYVGDELVSCERPIDAINLADLRAAIASHDASITPQDAAAPTVAEVPSQVIADTDQLQAFLNECRWMVIDATRNEKGWFADPRTQMCWHFWTKALKLKEHGHD